MVNVATTTSDRENTLKKVKVANIVTVAKFLLFFRGCAASLSDKGFDVSFISSPGEEQKLIRAEGSSVFAVPINREISPLNDLVSLWHLWRVLRRIRPDITNVGNPKAGLLGGMAAFLAGVPCRIYTLHGLRLETTTGMKRLILTQTERIACKCAHRVICVSPSLQQRAISLGLVKRAKTLVLANGTFRGVKIEQYAATTENMTKANELRHDLKLPKGPLVIGFVGRLTRDKGIPELMKAYLDLRRDFPGLRLLLVGDFEDGDPVPTSVQALIENDPFVLRTGFVENASAYYQLMDVLVLPTYREGFPQVNMEAQAAGVPVVTTCATGAIDSVQDGKTGVLVPVGNVQALSCAIKSLLDDADKRKKMGISGKEWVASEFSQEKVLAALVREYRDLLLQKIGPVDK